MDRRASNILGISVVAGILTLLLAAFFGVLFWAHSNAQPVISQPLESTARQNLSPAPALVRVSDDSHPAIKSKPGMPPEPEPRFPLGYNFALAAHGGKVSGGVRPELLLDGNSTNYDGGTGYGYTQWRAKDPFVIELNEAFEIDCVRFLLWDIEENRFYRYKLEVSDAPKGKWTMLADKTGANEECRSWQVLRFEKQKVKRLRLTGTFNSANSGFHVVEFQACLAPANGFPLEPRATYIPVPSTQKVDLEF